MTHRRITAKEKKRIRERLDDDRRARLTAVAEVQCLRDLRSACRRAVEQGYKMPPGVFEAWVRAEEAGR